VPRESALQHLTAVVVNGLATGKAVEIDGLGVFYPDAQSWFRFEPCTRPRVFIAYAKEDAALASRLYEQMDALGFQPWMDVHKLLPGQNWPRAIESAIDVSDFFVACFSRTSATKRGGFQAEIRYALDCARRAPLEEIFMVPVRLDDCRVPRVIQREMQYVDLFPDWESGVARLVSTLLDEWRRRCGA
jgi:TIR domain